jgi:hypothetical protein
VIKTKLCTQGKNSSVCDKSPPDCPFAHSARDARCFACHASGHFGDECVNDTDGPTAAAAVLSAAADPPSAAAVTDEPNAEDAADSERDDNHAQTDASNTNK